MASRKKKEDGAARLVAEYARAALGEETARVAESLASLEYPIVDSEAYVRAVEETFGEDLEMRVALYGALSPVAFPISTARNALDKHFLRRRPVFAGIASSSSRAGRREPWQGCPRGLLRALQALRRSSSKVHATRSRTS